MLPHGITLPFRLAKHFHSFPESHISLNLLWILCDGADGFPERASMQTDIFLYNQCRPLPILQCDAAIPQIFRMVINTIRDTNDFQRFQCLTVTENPVEFMCSSPVREIILPDTSHLPSLIVHDDLSSCPVFCQKIDPSPVSVQNAWPAALHHGHSSARPPVRVPASRFVCILPKYRHSRKEKG